THTPNRKAKACGTMLKATKWIVCYIGKPQQNDTLISQSLKIRYIPRQALTVKSIWLSNQYALWWNTAEQKTHEVATAQQNFTPIAEKTTQP
ncbi:MAG: hypothetical protein ACOX7D_03880, partial [Alphaproteobacteria bacterium]